MANLSTLLSVSEPSGFWVGIIRAFEGVTGNYVLAIIFLTVVIRLIWGIVETVNKYASQKQAGVQAKMQPELERIKAKYKNQPDLLARKQREVQQRYMGRGMIGIFLIMLVTFGLNMLVFFSLFSGLNTMAAYKAGSSYDNLKYQYANCLNVADTYLGDYTDPAKLAIFADYENIEFVVSEDGKNIGIFKDGELVENSLIEFKTDFSSTKTVHDDETDEDKEVKVSSNANILALIEKLKIQGAEESDQIVVGTKIVQDKEGNDQTQNIYLSSAVQHISAITLGKYYDINKDSFLWIENIWQSDSAFTKSMGDYKTIARQLGKNAGEKEENIYNAFMPTLKAEKNKVNGYFILPILCVLSSMLTLFITSLYNKMKNKKKGLPQTNQGFKLTYVIIPAILGIFALFYNSVFAIYMIVGQLVSALITPLQLLIVDKILDSRNKKEEEKVVIDYSRKF